MESRCYIGLFGTKIWRNEKGEVHRDNGPAIEYDDGGKWWYKNGRIHRDDGPAIEYDNGYTAWYKNGLLHTPTAHELITYKLKYGK